MSLRTLDDRVVPRLARTVQTYLGGGVRRGLARLDDRLAGRGPLALVRDVPQLGALLIAVVVLVGGGTALVRSSGPAPPPLDPATSGSASRAPGVPAAAFVGVQPGDDPAAYAGAAAGRLDTLASAAPDQRLLALVDFAAYTTPAQAAALLGDLEVFQAFYRPQAVPEAPVRSATVRDLARALPPALSAQAALLRADARASRDFAATIPGDNADERETKAVQLARAQTLDRQAAALAGSCTCVVAAVVAGPAARLTSLARQPQVRVVDPAPPGVPLDALEFGPLPPDVTATVPEPPGEDAPALVAPSPTPGAG